MMENYASMDRIIREMDIKISEIHAMMLVSAEKFENHIQSDKDTFERHGVQLTKLDNKSEKHGRVVNAIMVITGFSTTVLTILGAWMAFFRGK